MWQKKRFFCIDSKIAVIINICYQHLQTIDGWQRLKSDSDFEDFLKISEILILVPGILLVV